MEIILNFDITIIMVWNFYHYYAGRIYVKNIVRQLLLNITKLIQKAKKFLNPGKILKKLTLKLII